jgi:oligoribonuclease NrnB/cAMP/cGMP phosphodiesterase (DHH superfamily)
LYVDHHISALEDKFNAKRIHFETGETGPSAAFVLWKYLKNKMEIPGYITTLVEMSKITDTASYKSPAPTTQFEKQDYNITTDQIDSEKFHNIIWDLQDALTFETKTLKPNNLCLELLSTNGLITLLENEEVIKRINIHRTDRRRTLEYAESLTPTELTAIINPRTRNIQDILVKWLSDHGTKIVVVLKEDLFDKTCSVSLRQSKKNTREEKDRLRLDMFAKMFSESGGGHIEAAGSHIDSLVKGLEVVKSWGKEKNLEVSIFNVDESISR